jgi:HEAT repeat protein
VRHLALALALLLAACKGKDAKDPQTWITRLEDADPRARVKAVQELRKLKAKQAAPQIAALLKDPLVREDSALALQDLGGPSEVQALAHVVDDQSAPPALVKKAIVALGQIGDPAAIPALEHGLVLERQGVSFLPESSFALFLIGAPAVEPLLKIAQDQDPAYLAWAKANGRAQAGTYAKAALVLGDLEDARAIPVLMAKLGYTDPDPSPGTARLLTNLVRQFAANALGRLRAGEAAAPIQALVSTKDAQDEDVTTFSSEALVWIGDRSQARELIKKAQTGVLKLRLITAQAAALFGEPALGRDVLAIASKESKASNADCVKQLDDLTLPMADPKQACDLLATQFGELSLPLEAARVCAMDAPCWLPKISDKDPVVRARAAYELGRIGAAEAVPPLLKALAEEQLLVREAATRALDWLAAVPAARPALKSAEQQIAAQLAAEEGKIQYVKVNEELRRLQVKLSRL